MPNIVWKYKSDLCNLRMNINHITVYKGDVNSVSSSYSIVKQCSCIILLEHRTYLGKEVQICLVYSVLSET